MANAIYPKYKASTGEIVEGADYIESNGSELVNTLVSITKNDNVRVEIKGAKGLETASSSKVIMSLTRGAQINTWVGNRSDGKWGSSNLVTTTNYTTEADIVFTRDENAFCILTVNGETVTYQDTKRSDNFVVALFGSMPVSGSSTVSFPSKARMKSVKIYVNDVLVRDFVGAKNGSEYCLFDKVEKKLYSNLISGRTLTGGLKTEVNHIYPYYTIKPFELLESIESTGTQYIDTGYIPKFNSRVEFDYCFTSISTEYKYPVLFYSGERYNSADTFGEVYIDSEDRIITYFGNKNNIHGTRRIVNTRYKLTFTKDSEITKNVETGVEEKLSIGATSFTPGSRNLYICAGNSATADLNRTKAKIKIFRARIYEGGVLKRDFVPVKRINDGAIGLYDKVEGVFYPNAGTGTFIEHPLTIPKYIEEGLEQVDYIQSTGTQYIDTGVLVNRGTTNLRIVTRRSIENDNVQIAEGKNKTPYFFYGSYVTNNTFYAGLGNSFWSDGTMTNDKLPHVFELSATDMTFKVDGTVLHTFEGYGNQILAANIILGAISDSSPAIKAYVVGKLYWCQIWDGATLIRDFVPVKYKSVYYLYDKISKTLYQNKGTGAFTGGPRTEVKKVTSLAGIDNNGIRYGRLNYLESHGTEYIDTGVLSCTENGYELDFSIVDGAGNWSTVTGAGDSYTRYGYWLNGNTLDWRTNKSFEFQASDATTSSQTIRTSDVDVDTRYTVSIRNGVYTDAKGVSTTITKHGEAKFPYYIFAKYSYMKGAEQFTKAKIYGAKYYENEVLVRDFVPAVRLTDGVKGLFDKVNKIFYTNQGTGEFAGSLNYIELI